MRLSALRAKFRPSFCGLDQVSAGWTRSLRVVTAESALGRVRSGGRAEDVRRRKSFQDFRPTVITQMKSFQDFRPAVITQMKSFQDFRPTVITQMAGA